MEFIAQRLDDIVASLQPLKVDWQDDTAYRIITRLKAFPIRDAYTVADLRALLDENFSDGLLIVRLFLGLSKDQFTSILTGALDSGGAGVKRYRTTPDTLLNALVEIGILEAMAAEVNRKAHWSDVIVERLRSGRGSAIAGQRRGRGVEDFAEAIVKKAFGDAYEARSSFTGPHGRKAKCDFAIPTMTVPRIVIESKGYGATGSKMTDIIGDVEKIIAAKRSDTAFLFFTDGVTWKQRKSDLRKLVEYQNSGDITRIYTSSMAAQFEGDLDQLKREYGL